MTDIDRFAAAFERLTGYPPFRWQGRLFAEHFAKGQVPTACDIPTGLGKTAVMAVWLIAQTWGAALPRRLVYVVDRRAVVDQATRFAELLRDNAAAALGVESLPISTLRGQFLDNRRWLEDPSAIAIVVGTVDMVGSRLLFEGYGVGRGMRPYHAGMMGADTLIVLDESHLCPPFEALLRAMATDKEFRPATEAGCAIVPKLRLMSLSATGQSDDQNVFGLGHGDCDPEHQPIVHQRLTASKRLAIVDLPEGRKLEDALAQRAWELGKDNQRVIIFCDRRDIAEKAKTALKGPSKEKRQLDVELLVGARRVRERQELGSWLERHGFTPAEPPTAPDRPAFLVATSAGEVGVDLDADHMVGDLVAYERMVQRLGRVNRRGGSGRAATIDILFARPKTTAQHDEAHRAALDRLQAQKSALLTLIVGDDGRRDACPAAFVALKKAHPELVERATTPQPLRPALDRAVVDAWSLTSLREHPGRPEPAPWLRGWIEGEPPQTRVLWRRWLPWRVGELQPVRDEVEAFFAAARPHASEILETDSRRIADMLVTRAKELVQTQAAAAAGAGVVPFETQQGILILTSARELKLAMTTVELAALASKRGTSSKKTLEERLGNATIVVSASFGGLAEEGLLDAKESRPPPCLDAGWRAEETEAIGLRVLGPGETGGADWHEVYAFPLGSNEDQDERLTVVARRADGAPQAGDLAVARQAQSLTEHSSWTAAEAERLAETLKLNQDHRAMLVAAARLHDLGKSRVLWQSAMGAPKNGRPYAKTIGKGDPARLKIGGETYRHEFGSLMDAECDPTIRALPEPLRDLALHLIASHHGFARPVIAPVDPELPPSLSAARAQEAALRFARLQREWGPWGLAWWEAVLRAADQRASRRLNGKPE